MRLFTSEEAREIDRKAIEEFGIPGIVLMENAALQAVRVIEEEASPLRGRRVLVVAGKGKNGGDGFAVARHLSNRGAMVRVLLLGRREEVRGDARTNLEIASKIGIPVDELVETGDGKELLQVNLSPFDLIVDAIFGTGIKGPVRGYVAEVIRAINESGKSVISLDLPSGLDPDGGRVEGECIKAKRTVTFGVMKRGLLLYPGAEYAGQVHLGDIGVPPQLIDSMGAGVNLTTREEVVSWFPPRERTAHKGSFGHLLVVAGSPGLTGAATLASYGALRAGAGLVTVALPAGLQPIMAMKLTEVMTRALPQNAGGRLSMDALDPIIELAKGMSALAIGPGLSRDPETMAVVREVVRRASLPLVIDADGLNALSGSTGLLRERPGPTILTPHPGEMARLRQTSIEDIERDRLGHAIHAAEEWDAIVVLKGARTVIADEKGRVYVNPTGNPGMATGGSGDVLTGVIGGLVSQFGDPYHSAVGGVYLHGLAGDIAAREKGEESLTAGDILEALPLAFLELRRHDGDGGSPSGGGSRGCRR